MTISLMGVIVVVIVYDFTEGNTTGRVITHILARVLEFILGTLYLYSVGAGSFKKMAKYVFGSEASPTNTSKVDQENAGSSLENSC